MSEHGQLRSVNMFPDKGDPSEAPNHGQMMRGGDGTRYVHCPICATVIYLDPGSDEQLCIFSNGIECYITCAVCAPMLDAARRYVVSSGSDQDDGR